jgi:hypothetical protein
MSLFSQTREHAPIILGWGVNKEWARFRESIYDKVLQPLGRRIVGLAKRNSHFEYYHPWPRGGSKMDFKISWAPHIEEQLLNQETPLES